MGNIISNCRISVAKHDDPPECFLCNEITDECTPRVLCIRCNVVVHDDCFKTYSGDKTYCICPQCKEVGTMGVQQV
jgi:hypothetical protein